MQYKTTYQLTLEYEASMKYAVIIFTQEKPMDE